MVYMGRQIKLTEEELHNLINSKIKEAVNNLGYAPAIGNKKRGPGDEIEDQMTKRKNKKMDEGVDEDPIYRRLPDGETDYDGDDGIGGPETFKKTIELSDDAYAYAFENVYGRQPANLSDILEEYNLPFEIDVRVSLNIKSSPGDYYTPGSEDVSIDEWDIDDDSFDDFSGELRSIIRKAAEYALESYSPDELRESLSENRILRLSLTEIRSIIKESAKKVIKENKLWDAMTADMEKFAENGKDVYDFLDYATEKYGISEDQFYTSGGYEMWCDLTGEDPMDYEI